MFLCIFWEKKNYFTMNFRDTFFGKPQRTLFYCERLLLYINFDLNSCPFSLFMINSYVHTLIKHLFIKLLRTID